LPPDTFSGLKIYGKCVCGRSSVLDPAGELIAVPKPHNWILIKGGRFATGAGKKGKGGGAIKGMGRGRSRKGKIEKWKGREGKGGEGK